MLIATSHHILKNKTRKDWAQADLCINKIRSKWRAFGRKSLIFTTRNNRYKPEKNNLKNYHIIKNTKLQSQSICKDNLLWTNICPQSIYLVI